MPKRKIYKITLSQLILITWNQIHIGFCICPSLPPSKNWLNSSNTLPTKTDFRDPSNVIETGQIPGPSLHERRVLLTD